MKKVSESRSVLSEIMLPSQANPAGSVHGGEIMKLMDNCGSVAAMRHAKTYVVTVRVDELVFYQPIKVGHLVICESEVAFVGNTSMEVKVTVKVENMVSNNPAKIALTAFFTFVALDEAGTPIKVPELLLETEDEELVFEKRRQHYIKIKEKQKNK